MACVRADLSPARRPVGRAGARLGRRRQPSESERDIRVGGVDVVPAAVFDGVDYVALGHLHGRRRCARGCATAAPRWRTPSPRPASRRAWLVELDAPGLAEVRAGAAAGPARAVACSPARSPTCSPTRRSPARGRTCLRSAHRPGPARPTRCAGCGAASRTASSWSGARGGRPTSRSYGAGRAAATTSRWSPSSSATCARCRRTPAERELLGQALAGGRPRGVAREAAPLSPERLRAVPREVEVDLDAAGPRRAVPAPRRDRRGQDDPARRHRLRALRPVPGCPRRDRRLRSDHADPDVRTEVELEVTLGGRRWRITRSPAQERPKSRGTGTTTEQARSPSSAGRRAGRRSPPASTRARSSSTRLGMSADQFFQVVLLPQGDFARFLRAEPEDAASCCSGCSTSGASAVEDWLAGERRRPATGSTSPAAPWARCSHGSPRPPTSTSPRSSRPSWPARAGRGAGRVGRRSAGGGRGPPAQRPAGRRRRGGPSAAGRRGAAARAHGGGTPAAPGARRGGPAHGPADRLEAVGPSGRGRGQSRCATCSRPPAAPRWPPSGPRTPRLGPHRLGRGRLAAGGRPRWRARCATTRRRCGRCCRVDRPPPERDVRGWTAGRRAGRPLRGAAAAAAELAGPARGARGRLAAAPTPPPGCPGCAGRRAPPGPRCTPPGPRACSRCARAAPRRAPPPARVGRRPRALARPAHPAARRHGRRARRRAGGRRRLPGLRRDRHPRPAEPTVRGDRGREEAARAVGGAAEAASGRPRRLSTAGSANWPSAAATPATGRSPSRTAALEGGPGGGVAAADAAAPPARGPARRAAARRPRRRALAADREERQRPDRGARPPRGRLARLTAQLDAARATTPPAGPDRPPDREAERCEAVVEAARRGGPRPGGRGHRTRWRPGARRAGRLRRRARGRRPRCSTPAAGGLDRQLTEHDRALSVAQAALADADLADLPARPDLGRWASVRRGDRQRDDAVAELDRARAAPAASTRWRAR